MQHDDNWGWRARLGMFIVGNEAVPEAEGGHGLAASRSTHPASPPSHLGTLARTAPSVDLPEDGVAHASRAMPSPRWCSATVPAALSEGQAGMRPLSTRYGDHRLDTYVTTNLLDTLWALDTEVRPFRCAPCSTTAQRKWASPSSNAILPAGMRYDRDRLAGHAAGEPVHRMGFAQQIELLFAQTRPSPDADGVWIAGTGFRCVGILEALKRPGAARDLNNQASLWSGLRRAGAAVKVPGYGRLLTL